MISEADIAKAKETQNKYWESLWSDFTYFKKSAPTIDVFGYSNWSQYANYEDKFLSIVGSEYEWMRRYWASSFLDYHVFYMWNIDFFAGRNLENLDIKKASVQADKLKVDRIKMFKELYP